MKEEFILPEKWMLKIEKGNLPEILKYRKMMLPHKDPNGLLGYIHMGNCGWGFHFFDNEQVITYEQFLEHVVNKSKEYKHDSSLETIYKRLLA